ncbi:hypothetical protein M3650_30910, partial [Paenibacillus sp. MER TA 81-3]|nr:hypothetical protein [Paenibacillus sp. MER TA 81-3]
RKYSRAATSAAIRRASGRGAGIRDASGVLLRSRRHRQDHAREAAHRAADARDRRGVLPARQGHAVRPLQRGRDGRAHGRSERSRQPSI